MSEKYFIGYDIGGSSVKAALVKNKKIIKNETEFLPGNLEKLLKLLVKMKEKLIKGVKSEQIKGAGFALAGELDLNREIMLNSPNITYLNNQPLRKMFAEKFLPHPVKLEHDVHCFLLAEKELGLARGLKNVVFLAIGTGVGSAWMADGKIQPGAHGAAGEIGHMVIEAGSCLDFEALTANEFVRGKLGVGAAEAEKMVRAGDKKAKDIFAERGKNLGVGLANVINIFDPEAIILGGGVVSAKDLISPFIREKIDQFVISPAAKETKILFSELGREGGALGAALLFN